jgi:hypothetical protein
VHRDARGFYTARLLHGGGFVYVIFISQSSSILLREARESEPLITRMAIA